MKMPARMLFRGPAGMENGGAFGWCKAGQFEFLERRRRHSRNLRPMLDDIRCAFSRLANYTISGIVFELEREKFKSQLI